MTSYFPNPETWTMRDYLLAVCNASGVRAGQMFREQQDVAPDNWELVTSGVIERLGVEYRFAKDDLATQLALLPRECEADSERVLRLIDNARDGYFDEVLLSEHVNGLAISYLPDSALEYVEALGKRANGLRCLNSSLFAASLRAFAAARVGAECEPDETLFPVSGRYRQNDINWELMYEARIDVPNPDCQCGEGDECFCTNLVLYGDWEEQDTEGQDRTHWQPANGQWGFSAYEEDGAILVYKSSAVNIGQTAWPYEHVIAEAETYHKPYGLRFNGSTAAYYALPTDMLVDMPF